MSIKLSAEVECDICKQPICTGNSGVSPHWVMDDAVTKAKAKGAKVGVSTVTCRECLNRAAADNHHTGKAN